MLSGTAWSRHTPTTLASSSSWASLRPQSLQAWQQEHVSHTQHIIGCLGGAAAVKEGVRESASRGHQSLSGASQQGWDLMGERVGASGRAGAPYPCQVHSPDPCRHPWDQKGHKSLGFPYLRQGRSESHRSGLKILAVGPWASYFTSVPQILCEAQTIMPASKSCQKSDKSCLSKLRQGPY